MKTIAIISDIHGNSWALKELLRDIQSKGITTIINLGDSLYGPLDIKGTFELLTKNNVISISGNQDRFIIENLDIESNLVTLEYVKSQLNEDITNWLKNLPFDLSFENLIYCCHASPSGDSICLLENLQPDYVAVKDNSELDDLLSDIEQHIILCGHSHVPRVVETNTKIIINPGSAGLPAYDDDLPIPHKMESFTAHAKYSILEYTKDSLNINQVSITYDHEEAAKFAEKNRRNDWANWIRTGRA